MYSKILETSRKKFVEHTTPASEAGRWNHHSSVNTDVEYYAMFSANFFIAAF